MYDIYLYGMILATNSFLLRNSYPKPDFYGEISEKFRLAGGETGTCATVLSSLGAYVRMDGTYMGRNTLPMIEDFYKDKSVDISPLHFDETFDGLEDYVIIDSETRTPFGMFGKYFSDGKKRWSIPTETDIAQASVAAIDPFFNEESITAAKYCVGHGVPYVTIDCACDSYLHRNAAITIISGEYISGNCNDFSRKELFPMYAEQTEGLTIITNGSHEFFYGRKNSGMKTAVTFKVKTVSTLGAGDTFKAGCTYALLKKMSDDETVKFASACAAVACTKFPLPLNPPTLEEIEKIMRG